MMDCEPIDAELPFTVHRIRCRHNLLFSFKAAGYCRALNHQQAFDIVHGHGESVVGLLAMKKAGRINLPIASSVHILRKTQFKALTRLDGADRSAIRQLSKIKALVLERCYLRYVDVLTPVNYGLASEIEAEYGISKKVRVILNGVDVDQFDPHGQKTGESQTLCQRLSCSHVLLFVGVLNGRKGELDLLRAMPLVFQERPNARLIIVGKGPGRDAAQREAARLGIAAQVEFIGYLNRDEIKAYYHGCDVFVLPSYSEGLPKVVLEAMACGRPVVISDIPAHHHLIQNGINGYLCPIGDSPGLANVLITALSDTQARRQMAAKAREEILNHYTWTAVAARLDTIYKDMLSGRPIGSA
jgi:glycosyltransferase involved in cell wall biosynthesis